MPRLRFFFAANNPLGGGWARAGGAGWLAGWLAAGRRQLAGGSVLRCSRHAMACGGRLAGLPEEVPAVLPRQACHTCPLPIAYYVWCAGTLPASWGQNGILPGAQDAVSGGPAVGSCRRLESLSSQVSASLKPPGDPCRVGLLHCTCLSESLRWALYRRTAGISTPPCCTARCRRSGATLGSCPPWTPCEPPALSSHSFFLVLLSCLSRPPLGVPPLLSFPLAYQGRSFREAMAAALAASRAPPPAVTCRPRLPGPPARRLQNNDLSGSIPPEWRGFTALSRLIIRPGKPAAVRPAAAGPALLT